MIRRIRVIRVSYRVPEALPEPLLRQQAVLEKSTRKSPLNAVASRSGVSLLFVTRTCPYCRQAKSFLNEKGLPYQEYDVETSEGQRMFVAAGGGQGVPVLVQNDKRQAGFSRRSYEKFFGLGK